MDIFTILNNRIANLSSILQSAGQFPEAIHFRVKTSQGKQYLYFRDELIHSSEKAKIAELSQKKYESVLYKTASDEMSALKKCVEILKKCGNTDNVFDSLPEIIRTNVKQVMDSDDEYACKWQSEHYKKRFIAYDAGFTTSRGDRVRSKSELIIAERLFANDIPYKYERPMHITEDLIIHPDFTVLNKRTHKEYYWEHLGMLDDSQYANDAVKRINLYLEAGIIVGDNLLLSAETSEARLSTKQIDLLIETNFK